jgi:hypothetical protein
MKRAIFGLLAMAIAPLLLGCEEPHPGSIAGAQVPLAYVGPGVGAPVEVALPRDVRPPVEHEGQRDGTSLFFTILVVTHWETRGNYLTNDFAATSDASGELRSVVANALYGSRAASPVPPGAAAPFALEIDIEHLYATHYTVHNGTVVVLAGKRAAGGGANAFARDYASYGNVTLLARLVEKSSHKVLWEEHVSGFGQAPPNENDAIGPAQIALRQAVGDATGKLVSRVATALDRLGAGPGARTGSVAAGVPSAFVVERVSRLRDFIEYLTIESASGKVVSDVIKPLANRAYARPGDWLLSRRTLDGAMLDGESYDALAHGLATRYDLRTYDDANRYHFFGLKGVVAPPR